MAHADFVHLRVHTAYSLAEGALTIKELVKRCAAAGMPAVAMTDSMNMFGGLEFAVTAAKAGIQPIIGVELHLHRRFADGGGPARSPGQDAADSDRLVLLAQTESGFANLTRLVSQAYLHSDGGAPLVGAEALRDRTEGVIALTGGPDGGVGRLLAERRGDRAAAHLAELAALFGDRLYVEIQRHFLDRETGIEAGLIDLAFDRGIPLVATNECLFADQAMHEAHEVLLCIAQGRTIHDEERQRASPHHYFKSAPEMRALFHDLPEAVDNTLVIAQRCAFMPTVRTPIFPAFPTEAGRSEAEELRIRARAGLAQRMQQIADGDPEPYRRRLEFELDTIIEMGFPGYFLIVADIIQWAKRQGIPVGPGRGSGAGSVAAWSLLITDLDPLRWGLLFERFLNPERVSMPDFDIDFCQDRRGEVIDYIRQRYGRDRVAQIITFGTLQARAALRDVGRVLAMPHGQVDRLCKLVPNNPANPVSLAKAIEGEPELRRQRDEDPAVDHLLRIAQQLEGLYRNASTHAAGIVIGDRPLDQLVPLYRDPRSELPATQYNMKWVESAGLVKFDILGLKTLTVLDRAVALLRRRGIEVDLGALPLDDAATYAMLGRGDGVGVFQLESSGMRDVLRRLKPDRFEDIIALVALYRPGPMANIPKYIATKHGEEEADYLHPELRPVLEETYGILIYQEQVQQAAQILAGYSLAGADLLRRAMGKKIKAEMDAQRETFVDGAVANGVAAEKATRIFEQMAAFAGYGFNKSHAAAYALVAYQTAWLKANHPVEFLAASMTYDIANTDRLNLFRQELQALDIPLLGPDINRSAAEFSVEAGESGGLAIRYALGAIRNVGMQAMRQLVAEREAKGAFRDLADLAERLDVRAVNKRMLENLVRAGALDSLHPNRAQLVAGCDLLLRRASIAAETRQSDQVSLFALDAGRDSIADILPAQPEWPPLDRLRQEFEAVGFYLSAHPLDAWAGAIARMQVLESDTLPDAVTAGASRVTLAGIVLGARVRTNARGGKYAFVQMTDRRGVFEITLFSETLARSHELLTPGRILLVHADAKAEGGDGLRLIATRVAEFERAIADVGAGLQIRLCDTAPLQKLATLLTHGPTGRGRIEIVVDTDDDEITIPLPQTYMVSADLRTAIAATHGVTAVRDI